MLANCRTLSSSLIEKGYKIVTGEFYVSHYLHSRNILSLVCMDTVMMEGFRWTLNLTAQIYPFSNKFLKNITLKLMLEWHYNIYILYNPYQYWKFERSQIWRQILQTPKKPSSPPKQSPASVILMNKQRLENDHVKRNENAHEGKWWNSSDVGFTLITLELVSYESFNSCAHMDTASLKLFLWLFLS